MKSKIFLTLITVTMLVAAMVVPVQANEMEVTIAEVSLFKDVPLSHYAYTEITNLAKRDIVKGFSDGTFKPTKDVTRAEFASFVARALELPAADSNFKDVSKSMALYDGVSRASKAGIIKGFANGTFKPNTPVSREDMAVMLDRGMQLKGSFVKTQKLDFADNAKIGAYATESVKRMYFYGVMNAHSGKNFNAKTIGNRAETAKAIFNMLAAVNGVIIEPPAKPEPPTTDTPNTGDTGNYVPGDTTVVQGYTYTFNGAFWIDEFGNISKGGKYPAQDKTTFKLTKGQGLAVHGPGNGQDRMNFNAHSLIFTYGLDFSKNELHGIINSVVSTGKPVTVKGYRFELYSGFDKTKPNGQPQMILTVL